MHQHQLKACRSDRDSYQSVQAITRYPDFFWTVSIVDYEQVATRDLCRLMCYPGLNLVPLKAGVHATLLRVRIIYQRSRSVPFQLKVEQICVSTSRTWKVAYTLVTWYIIIHVHLEQSKNISLDALPTPQYSSLSDSRDVGSFGMWHFEASQRAQLNMFDSCL